MEKWLPVSGYEGAYEVSDLGRVRSLDVIRKQKSAWGGKMIEYHKKGKILSPHSTNSIGRYLMVQLRSPKKKEKYFLVHRLVAETFVKNDESKLCVNHLNNIKNDNRASNLEWSSYKENTAHGLMSGNINKNRMGVTTRRLDEVEKNEILRLYREGNFSQRKIAIQLSLPETTVNSFLRRELIKRI